ncbi:hypothetical protein N2152v2_010776 [Parachlorella kessleri]
MVAQLGELLHSLRAITSYTDFDEAVKLHAALLISVPPSDLLSHLLREARELHQQPPPEGEAVRLLWTLAAAATVGLRRCQPDEAAPWHGRWGSQAATEDETSAQRLLATVVSEAFAGALSLLTNSQLPAVQQALARTLLGQVQQACQLGLALLVQFTAQLLLEVAGQAPLLGEPQQWLAEWQEQQGQSQPLWVLLRELLLDSEPLNRKRAAHVLKAATDRVPSFQLFFKLLDTLENFSPHLIQDVWGDINRLHPPQGASQPPSASTGSPTVRRKISKQPAGMKASAQGKQSGTDQQEQQQRAQRDPGQEQLQAGGDGSRAPALPFAWMRVLWVRGLTHRNPHVQRIVLGSLLTRDWWGQDPAVGEHLRSMPVSFLGRDLPHALGQAHIHKQGTTAVLAAEVGCRTGKAAPVAAGATAGAEPAPDCGSTRCSNRSISSGSDVDLSMVSIAAVRLVRQYCAVVEWQRQRELLLCLLHLLAYTEPSRLLFCTAVAMLEVVAEAQAASAPSQEAPVIEEAELVRSEGQPATLRSHGQAANQATRGSGSSSASFRDTGGEGPIFVGWDDELVELFHQACKNVGKQGTSNFVMGTYKGLLHAASYIVEVQQAGQMGPLAGAGPSTEGPASWAAGEIASVLQPLAGTLAVMYRRPYLGRGMAERSLALLVSLLEVCNPIHTTPRDLSAAALHCWLAQLLVDCAEELCSYTLMKSQALWTAPTVHNSGGHAQPSGRGAAAVPLAEELAASLSLALLCVRCLTGVLPLLATSQSAACFGGQQQQQRRRQHDMATESCGAALRRCSEALLSLVEGFAVSYDRLSCSKEAGAAASIPGSEALGVTAQAASSGPSLEETTVDPVMREVSTRQLECLAACLAGLAAAATTPDDPPSALPLPSLAALPGRLLPILLNLHSREVGRPGAVQYSKWWWRAVDSLLDLQRQPVPESLGGEVAGRLLGLAISGLATGHRSYLIPTLRCVRALLPLAVRNQPTMLQHALDSRVEAAHDPAAEGLAGLLSWLYSSAWAACTDAIRRQTGMTAALVATCLHPALFDIQTADDSRIALHSEGGPVRWLVDQLIAVGQRSTRVMALTALQLCGLWGRRPAAAVPYWDVLQGLCLYGVAEEGGDRGEVLLDAESTAELAAVMQPTDPQLAEAFATTAIAPRVAVLCLLHEWAICAATRPVEGTAEAAPVTAAIPGATDAATAGVCPAALHVDGRTSSPSAPAAGDATVPSTGAAHAARHMWAQLLKLAMEDPELGSNKYFAKGPTHRRKVRLWQALCVLCPAVPAQQLPSALGTILTALQETNAASVKQYQESIAVQLVGREPALFQTMVMPVLRDYSSQTDAAPSLVLVGAQLLLSQLSTGNERAPVPTSAVAAVAAAAGDGGALEASLVEFVRAVVGWTLSHVHATRTFSQLVLWRLLELRPQLVHSDPSLAALLAFFTANPDIRRLRAGLGANFERLELELAATPRGVLGQGRWPMGLGPQSGSTLEGAPMPLLDHIQDFLVRARADLRGRVAGEQAANAQAELSRGLSATSTAPPAPPQGTQHHLQQQLQLQQSATVAGEASPALGSLPNKAATGQQGQIWQRKSTPLEQSLAIRDPFAAALGLEALASGGKDVFEEVLAGAAAEVASQGGPARQHLIVVATLVGRVPNLAGLCRTCEVFGAGCLVLADASVTKDPSFAGISVTAEMWIPIKEVSGTYFLPVQWLRMAPMDLQGNEEAALLPWLQRQAALGYRLVGLEQTSQSTRLHDFRFPEKTVLVLGREKEGIPADVLAQLHDTVEIPQLGLIRSLNVHVSGAIAAYEYTRQRLESQ